MGADGMGAGMNGAHRTMPAAQKVDQLNRSDLGIYFRSTLGKISVTYQDNLGTRCNSLGGGMGQTSTRATFSSPSFGGGMFHFSASIVGSSHSGFSASSMNGNESGKQFSPGGAAKRSTSTVSLHLSF